VREDISEYRGLWHKDLMIAAVVMDDLYGFQGVD
jgi:hypothetical protein